MKTPSWSWASVNGLLARSWAFLDDWICLADAEISVSHQLHEDHSKAQVNTTLLRICTSYAEVEWKDGQPDILGSLKQSSNTDECMEVTNLRSIEVVLDGLNHQPRDGARHIIAAHSSDINMCFLESLILRKTNIAGVVAYERMGVCIVGIQRDKTWSDMSSEEVARRFSTYGWNKKEITLC
jgi:hypothetical protein